MAQKIHTDKVSFWEDLFLKFTGTPSQAKTLNKRQ
jgi:hypothetical protein